MRKIMVILALAASFQMSYAQKSQEAVKKAIESAEAASQNPKKAEKVATWLGLAKAQIEAYTAPQGNGMIGMAKQELQLIMTAKPLATSQEEIGGNVYDVETYPSCKYYFANGALAMIVVTKPYVDGDILAEALKSYSQAARVDPKGTKTKDIKDGINAIGNYYLTDANNAYMFGDMAASSVNFEKAFEAFATEPNAVLDSASLYNAGSTALFNKNYERAKALLQRCLDYNFLEKGEVHARLAECYKQLGDKEKSLALLEEGFTRCPENQGILVGLINIYNEEKADPEKIIALLNQAKVNEPSNASLYYVEGNIRKEMGMIDKAAEAYDQCITVNPECEMGLYYKAVMFLEQADKIGEAAQNEMDNAKYAELLDQRESFIIKSLEPFEQCFAMSKDSLVKNNVSQYLKNVYFLLREKSDEYMQAYEKYNEIAKSFAAQQ